MLLSTPDTLLLPEHFKHCFHHNSVLQKQNQSKLQVRAVRVEATDSPVMQGEYLNRKYFEVQMKAE